MSGDVRVRLARIEDAEELAAIYEPYVRETAITFEYVPPTPAEFAERMRKTTEFYPYLVAELDGRLVGYAYAGTFKGRPAYDWAVETSIYVAQGHAGEGIGRALHDALERALAAQGVLNMYACIAVPDGEDDWSGRSPRRAFSTCTPASPSRMVRMTKRLPATASISTNIWDTVWWGSFTNAGSRAAVCTTWSGWRRCWGSTVRTNLR